MATSRLARIATEVAPPRFVKIMRCRTQNMDTIYEEKESSPDVAQVNSRQYPSLGQPVPSTSNMLKGLNYHHLPFFKSS